MFLSQAPIRASAGDDRSPWGSFWFEPVGNRTSAGVRVNAASALALPAVWACVNVLAKSFAVMPFRLYKPGPNGRGPRLRDHWLTRLFCKRPNQFQSPFEWRLMLMGHLALRGNAFCQVVANRRGEIVELLPLHPDRMRMELLSNGDFRYLYTDQNGREIVYLRGEIWHLRALSNDGLIGLNPIEVHREAIGEGLSMQSYSSRFFANDARPAGWIEFDGKFANDAARKTFKASWQESQGGSNVRKVAVLERGMKYHQLALNNSDAQFIEARNYKTSEIARIFGVPPHKIADLSKATFSNIEQQSIEFWTDCMLPWAELWESSIEAFLLPDGVDLEPEFDMSRMLRGDSAARSTYYQNGIQSGWLTRNEAREAEGFDPLENLDEPLVPLNMIGADDAPDPDDPAGSEDGEPTEPTDPAGTPEQRRLQAILTASAGRLSRRAVGALAKKPAASVFDDEFASLTAEALGVSEARAIALCEQLRAEQSLTSESIERALVTCANAT